MMRTVHPPPPPQYIEVAIVNAVPPVHWQFTAVVENVTFPATSIINARPPFHPVPPVSYMPSLFV